jgi:hypothetical protein
MGKRMIKREDIQKMDRKDPCFLTIQLCSLIWNDIDDLLEKYEEVLEKVKKIKEFKNEKVEIYLLEKMMEAYENKYVAKKEVKREEKEEEKCFGKRKRGVEENVKMSIRPMIEMNPFQEKVEKEDLPEMIKKQKKNSFGKDKK